MVLRIRVLGSTRGTDLRGVINAIGYKTLTGVEIVQVVCNREDTGILDEADTHGISFIFSLS